MRTMLVEMPQPRMPICSDSGLPTDLLRKVTRSLSQDELAQLLEFLKTIPRHAALESSQALHLPSFMLLGQESLNREP